MNWAVNQQNNAERFWDSLREMHPDFAERLEDALGDGSTSVALSGDDLETLQSVPGWGDGPERPLIEVDW